MTIADGVSRAVAADAEAAARRTPSRAATTVAFATIGLADRPRVGGKGASLGELTRSGIAVPPGFVVTTEAFAAFADTLPGLRAPLDGLRADNLAGIGEATARIRARVLEAPLPEALREAIAGAHAALVDDNPSAPVAVRSSATSEDSSDASFAGLQDTFLWVCGRDAVVDAVRRCWASLYSEPSVAYRLRLGLPEAQVAMGVVVQRMVDARCAGVMFTRSPTTGDRSVVAVNASWGLGSAMVSGEVTPDEYVLNKVTGEVIRRTISDKAVRDVPKPGGGVAPEPVPDDERRVACLDEPALRSLLAMAERIERHYGHAMDIEWAFDAVGQLFILQSRPETVWSQRDAQAALEPLATPKTNPFLHVLAAMGGERR